MIDHVNLFLGTAGDHGQLYPGAEMPFGLVKLAPDTYPGAVTGSAHAGYDYDDQSILGFSHTRFSGVGNRGVGGNILVQPTVRDDVFAPQDYAAPCDKDSEEARPGYYSVSFESGIRVELSATNHVGFHRYTYPAGAPKRLVLDLGRGFTPIRDAHCLMLNPTEIVGEFTSNQMNAYGWYRMYFCMRLSEPVADVQMLPEYREGGPVRSSAPDGQLVANIRFAESDAPLMVKLALSSIGAEQARRNLDAEVPGWDFEAAVERCAGAWQETLARVEVKGKPEHMDLFYSHFYRICLSPFHATSCDGAFMSDDGSIRPADGFTFYNGWSIWDTYRTKFPWLAFTEPERTRDFMHSLALTLGIRFRTVPMHEMPDSNGFSPVPNVRFELANAIMLDAFAKGIDFIDPEAAYEVMAQVADLQWANGRDELGYVPERPHLTCEYAYDNWATARMAEVLGKPEDAAAFDKRANNHRNTWDPDIKFPRARAENGEWLDFPEDPTVVEEKYVYEGSMWHWRYAAIHNVADMVELAGGAGQFMANLEYFFEHDLYNMGNEPGIHMPWLFAAAGAPWLSQKWVRRILTEPFTQLYGTHGFLPERHEGPIFRNTPDGLIEEMDDDDGCMAAWYTFSTMGLFPLCPGRPLYVLGMPLFEEIVVHNQGGEDFRIRVINWAGDNWYIQSAQLNDKLLDRPWLTHAEIVTGGFLDIEAGPEPNKEWGTTHPLPW